MRRSRSPVRHHHQRLAHLPGGRADQRQQPVFRVHVPRQHRLQPGLAQPPQVRRRREPATSTSRPTGTRSASGRSCSRSACSWRSSRSEEIARLATTTAPSVSATPTSARAHAVGIAYDSDEARAFAGAMTADHDRRDLCHLRRDGRAPRPVPRLRRQPGAHAAGHPQPPSRRLRRADRRSTSQLIW